MTMQNNSNHEDLTDVHLILHIEFENDIYKSIHKLHKFVLVRESGKFFKALLSKKWRKHAAPNSYPYVPSENQDDNNSTPEILDTAFYRSISSDSMLSKQTSYSIPEGQILEIDLELPELISNYYELSENQTQNFNQSIDKSFNHAFEDSFVSQASISSPKSFLEKSQSSTSLSRNCENFVTPKPRSTLESTSQRNLNETKLNRLLQSMFHYVYYKENSLENAASKNFYDQITMSELLDYIIVADYFLLKEFKAKLIEIFCSKFFSVHIEMFVLIEILGRFDFLCGLYEKALDYVRVNFGKIVIGMCVSDRKEAKSGSFIFSRNSTAVFNEKSIQVENNPVKSVSHMENIEELFKIDFEHIDQFTLRLILDEKQQNNHFGNENANTEMLLAGFGDQYRPSTIPHSSTNMRSNYGYSPSSTPRKKISKLDSDSWRNSLKNCFTGGNQNTKDANDSKNHPALLELLSMITFPTIKKILENNPNGKDNQIFDIIILYTIAQSHHNKIIDLYHLKEQAIELLRNYLKIQKRPKNDQVAEILNWIRADSEYEYMDWKNKIEKTRSKYCKEMIKNRRKNFGNNSEDTDYKNMMQSSERYYVFKYFFDSALKIFSSGNLNYDQITRDNVGSFLISILKIWLQCNDSDIKAPPTPKRRKSMRSVNPNKRILTRGQKRSLSPLPGKENADINRGLEKDKLSIESQVQMESLYRNWGQNSQNNLLKSPHIARKSDLSNDSNKNSKNNYYDPAAFQQMANMEDDDYKQQDKRLAIKFCNSSIKTRDPVPFDAALIIGGWQGNDKYDVDYGACTLCHAYDQYSDKWYQHQEQNLKAPSKLCYNGICYIEPFIYIAGGYDGNNKHTAGLSNTWSLNVKTLKWQELSPMFSKRLYLTCSAYPENNSFFAVGGGTSVTEYKRERIPGSNPAAYEKIQKMPLPPYKNNKGKLKLVEEYDINKGVWRTLPYMNDFRSDSSSIVINDNLIVCGGFDGKKCLDTVEYFNYKGAQMWCHLSNMRTLRSGLSLVYYQDSLVAMGGYPGKVDNYISGEREDGPRLDTWEVMTGVTELFENIALTEKIQDKSSPEYEKLKSRQDTFHWKHLPSKFNTGRSNFGACVLNDNEIIICGGYNHQSMKDEETGDWKGGTLNKCERFVGNLYNQVKTSSAICGFSSSPTFRKDGWEKIDSLPVELSAMTVITVSSSDEPLNSLLGKTPLQDQQ